MIPAIEQHDSEGRTKKAKPIQKHISDEAIIRMFTERREAALRETEAQYGQMSRSVLQELASAENAEEAADRLMQTALDNGGKDNITLILMTDETGPAHDGEEPSAADEAGGEAEA